MQTYAVINQKGGVGKTTTVANLGTAVAARGRTVCLIDLDPQAHLTLHFGLEPDPSRPTMYDVMTTEMPPAQATTDVQQRLRLIPAVIDLAAAEVELVSHVGREQILRDKLAQHPPDCELAFVDCPPSLGLLTLNALAAADEVLIPLQPHFLALQGLGQLLETVSLVQRRINPRLRVAGIVLCMYESTTRLAGEVAADLREFFEGARRTPSPWSQTRIFQTVIRRNIKLAECPSYGKTIFEYEPNSHGAEDYRALAEEFLDLLASRAPAPAARQTEPARPEQAVETNPQPNADGPPPHQQAEPADLEPSPDSLAPSESPTES